MSRRHRGFLCIFDSLYFGTLPVKFDETRQTFVLWYPETFCKEWDRSVNPFKRGREMIFWEKPEFRVEGRCVVLQYTPAFWTKRRQSYKSWFLGRGASDRTRKCSKMIARVLPRRPLQGRQLFFQFSRWNQSKCKVMSSAGRSAFPRFCFSLIGQRPDGQLFCMARKFKRAPPRFR